MSTVLTLALLPVLSVPPTALPGGPGPFADGGGVENRITPVVRVVEMARPAVVSIVSVGRPGPRIMDFWGRLYPSPPNQTSGSGVVLFDDGYVMTNHHVVRGAQQILVHFDEADDPREYTAHVVSAVPEEDLALLKLDSDGPFPTIPLCATDPILGETVVAIGNPYRQTHTVSTGIVSGLHRNITVATGFTTRSGEEEMTFSGLLQTDASINPGNSGGPLLNINGELIGINSAMNTMAENIGFAIPVARIRAVLNEKMLSTQNMRSYLGFDVDESSFRVTRVDDGGPAAEAGLHEGDQLLSIDGRKLGDRDEYRLASIQILPGNEVDLGIERQGSMKIVKFEAWSSANGHLLRRLGMTAGTQSLGQRNSTRMVRVEHVEPDGPASKLGLMEGDLIEYAQIPGRQAQSVGTPEELAWLVKRLQPGEELEVELWRDDDHDGHLERYPSGYSELYRGEITVR